MASRAQCENLAQHQNDFRDTLIQNSLYQPIEKRGSRQWKNICLCNLWTMPHVSLSVRFATVQNYLLSSMGCLRHHHLYLSGLRNGRTSFSTYLGFSRGEKSKKKTKTIISGHQFQCLNIYLCFSIKIQISHEGL